VEQQQVHREAGEAHPLAVDDGQQLHRFALDARLLQHLLHHHFAGRVADIGPAGGVQPHTAVAALHEQDLAESLPTMAPMATFGVT
jgi:tRNA1(Val) A37 N6-methylase TrmN6